MSEQETVPERLAGAISRHADRPAMASDARRLTYCELGAVVERMAPHVAGASAVGVFGAPGVAMAAACTACVIHGVPFVHLDPAMPQMVLHNVVAELGVTTVVICQPAAPGLVPGSCAQVDAEALLRDPPPAPSRPLRAAEVAPEAPIYLVATSGTTGRPKCIPVSHDAARLSYEWRDAYTPYGPGFRVGIYVFAIWEMFRPLRDGAELWFPDANTLMAPRGLADFLVRRRIDEMLFTPSFYETFLGAVDPGTAARVPLKRVILNGEVVGDDLIAASLDLLPGAELWNLYSICETHDVCMTRLTAPSGGAPAPVGVPMEHLRAVILDEGDAPCPPGTSGLLHFEGPRMLGPGYVNRPEETRLRFREMTLGGRAVRLYDTGDRARLDARGALHVEGRVAHMLKLRGYSIQTRELIQSMRAHLAFGQAMPWVSEVAGRGRSLVFYFAAGAEEARANADRWGLGAGTNRMPAALAARLREGLPAYCVPGYLVQMDAIPLHPVSGKGDPRALPPVSDHAAAGPPAGDAVLAAAAEAMGLAPERIDPALSFHEQGGDSLMCVAMMTRLEAAYGRPVDFDLAMNVPLHRLDQLLTEEADAPPPTDGFERPGILLTGATGFLGGHVLARAARDLPAGHVVYCLVRDRRRGARDRLDGAARAHGLAADRYAMVPGTLDAPRFGLEPAAYGALAGRVRSVVHCAAMVNMAIGAAEMRAWSSRGTEAVLAFCRAAAADLRFTSSTAVFPDRGGPWPEGPARHWDGITGYGAAKIDAEDAIRAAGVPSALVRLPSLYDLARPNPRDIYEIVLRAALEGGAWPRGLRFPMIDVEAAAAFVLGPIVAEHAPTYNLVAGSVVPDAPGAVDPAAWCASADLPPGIARVLAEHPDTLHADATFETAAARAAWARVSTRPFEAIGDPEALLACRAAAYQGEPALSG